MEVILFDHRVQDFINTLEDEAVSRVWRILRILENKGHLLRMPHARMIEAGLYELRIIGHQEVRLFYTFKRNRAWVLHGFIKKTVRLPETELITARARKSALPSL